MHRKKLIVFAFEGKNNKTEMNYFHNFEAPSKDSIIKCFSSGYTDLKNMIDSTKSKRSRYDYNPKEDLTFIFVDEDSISYKKEYIDERRIKLSRDIHIIVSKPCFEMWFLNHFIQTTKFYTNNSLMNELKKYINDYHKNLDIYPIIKDRQDKAIINSLFQLKHISEDSSYTEVVNLFSQKIIKEKS